MYEYEGCVVMERGRRETATWDEEVRGWEPSKRGRVPNYWEHFHPECPLAETHRLVLRSKQVVPRLGVGPPPKVPRGPRPEEEGEDQSAWDKRAATFAAYMLVLFKPWRHDKPLTDLSWGALMKFCNELGSSNRVRDRFRLRVMQNIAGENLCNGIKHHILAERRGEEATRWNHNYGEEMFMRKHDRTRDGKEKPKAAYVGTGGPIPSMVEPGDIKGLHESEDLEDLLGDAERDAAYERNLALYVENTRASLRRVYDTTVHDKGEEIPASPQPPAVMPVVRSHEQVVMELKLAKAKLKPVTAASRRGANGIHDEEVGDRAILQFQHQGSGDHDELAFNWGKWESVLR